MKLNEIFRQPSLKNIVIKSTPVWSNFKRKISTFKNQYIFYEKIQYFRSSSLAKLSADSHQPAWTKRSILDFKYKKFYPILFSFKIGKYQVIVANKQQKFPVVRILSKSEQKPLGQQRFPEVRILSKSEQKPLGQQKFPEVRILSNSEQKPLGQQKFPEVRILSKSEQKPLGQQKFPEVRISSKSEQKPLLKQLPNHLREKAINIITSDIQTSRLWESYATDIAVHAITKLPNWPKNRWLKIKNIVGNYSEEQEFGNHQNSNPLKLILKNNHYQPIIDGVEQLVARDGNCFYHSVLLSLTAAEQRQLLGVSYIPYHRKTIQDDYNNPNIGALRQLLSDHLKNNHDLIDEIVKENSFNYESIVKEKSAKNSSMASPM